jgi:hypothetical protein
MRGSRFRFLAFPLLAFLSGLVFALYREPELSYQGMPLNYWFNQLPLTIAQPVGVSYASRWMIRGSSGVVRKCGDWIESPETSAAAIRSMGTNAINFYLGKLTRQYGPLKRAIFRSARSLGYHGLLFEEIYPEREQAATALILLQPLPPGAVSVLANLSTNRDPQVAAAAHTVLTSKRSELMFLQHPVRKPELDLDLLNLPDLSNAK